MNIALYFDGVPADYTCLPSLNADVLAAPIGAMEDLNTVITLVENVDITTVKRMQLAQTIYFLESVDINLAETLVAGIGAVMNLGDDGEFDFLTFMNVKYMQSSLFSRT